MCAVGGLNRKDTSVHKVSAVFFGFRVINDWFDTEWIIANAANKTLAKSMIAEKEPQSNNYRDKQDYKLD